MKYSVHDYARALAEVSANVSLADPSAAVKNFAALVMRNGDASRLPKIVEEAERILRAHGGPRKLVITTARHSGDSLKALIAAVAQKGDAVETVVDPSLVAGATFLINDEMQFDGSLKKKLEKLFGN